MRAALADLEQPDEAVVSWRPRCHASAAAWHALFAGWDSAGIARADLGIDLLCGSCADSLSPEAVPSHIRPYRVGHCLHLLVNRPVVDQLAAAGGYVVSPGWLERWRHFLDSWGLDQAQARDLFGEIASKLVLLDTGLRGDSTRDDLAAFADYVGLPAEVLPVGLDLLRLHVERLTEERAHARTTAQLRAELAGVRRAKADLAMAADLAGTLSLESSVEATIEATKTLFTTLFAPRQVSFRLGAILPVTTNPEPLTGFSVALVHSGAPVGVIDIEGLLMPQHRAAYLDVARTIAPICALVISAALARRETADARQLTREAEVALQTSQQRLHAAERLELAGRIVGQVAHDFNNLLSPLVSYPELIKLALPENHQANVYCDRMIRTATRMAEINASLLTLARRSYAEKKPTTLEQVVHAALEHLEYPSTIDIVVRAYDSPLPIRASAAQLARAIANLVANAREAMCDSGRITLTTRRLAVAPDDPHAPGLTAGQYALLSVADRGPGMPPDVAAHIFEPFFTTKTGEPRRGAGLGLSIVQTVIDDHQGAVHLETAPGAGARFDVYLPLAGEAVASGPAPVPAAGAVRGGSESILIVDDDPVQREVISRVLGALGYAVEAAASGELALERVRARPVDLVTLDMVMPGGWDGAETLRQLREARPGLRAIIVSGYAESDRVREALRLGALGVVHKPISRPVLAQAVRAALESAAPQGATT